MNVVLNRRRWAALVVGLALFTSILAACGGGDDGTEAVEPAATETAEASAETAAPAETGAPAETTATAGEADVEGAAADIETLKAIPEFSPPGPAIDLTTVEGKTIFNIPISSEIPFVAGIDEGMARIAGQAGVKFIQYPNQGQPSQWVQGINQAIAQNVDLIVLQAAPNPELLQPQLKQAQDAGIPVLLAHLLPEGSPLPPNIDALMPVPFHEAARAEVDYAVMESGAETNALIITSSEVLPSDGIVQAMQEQLATRCPECTSKVVNVPITDWATKIQGEVQSALVADPSINWVIPIYDSMSQFAVPGIVAAGREGAVRISTFNGTPFVLEFIQDGDVVAMDIGESLDWIAYANMDQAFRLLAGMEPLETENLPLRVFDDSNVEETGTPPTFADGYGDSYVTGYEELWGLSG